jgi:hypothetical protein
MTNYEKRKSLRIKLNNKRNKDNDHSPKRYTNDAKVLNRAMSLFKIKGKLADW